MDFPSNFTPLLCVPMSDNLPNFSPMASLNPVNERDFSGNLRANRYVRYSKTYFTITCSKPMGANTKSFSNLSGIARPSGFPRANLTD
jgi:hypothetical protein